MNSVTIVRKLSDEQIDDAEHSPEPAEPLEDQLGVTHAGHRAEPDHHLLVHDKDRDEQQQDPQQAVAVVLTCLGVGRDASRVVVAHHHDQAGTDDREERHQPPPPARARLVAGLDPAQRALDLATFELGLVGPRMREHRRVRLGPNRRAPWRGRLGRLRWRGRLGRLRRGRLAGCAGGAGSGWPAGPGCRALVAGVPPARFGHGSLPRLASGGSAASRRRQSSGSVTSSTSSTVISPIIVRSSSTTGMVIRL